MSSTPVDRLFRYQGSFDDRCAMHASVLNISETKVREFLNVIEPAGAGSA